MMASGIPGSARVVSFFFSGQEWIQTRNVVRVAPTCELCAKRRLPVGNRVRVRYVVRVEWQASQRYSHAIVNGRRSDEWRAQPSFRHPPEIVRSIKLFHSSGTVVCPEEQGGTS